MGGAIRARTGEAMPRKVPCSQPRPSRGNPSAAALPVIRDLPRWFAALLLIGPIIGVLLLGKAALVFAVGAV